MRARLFPGVFGLVVWCAGHGWAQAPAGPPAPYRLLVAKNCQALDQELERAAREGYAVELGWPSYELVLLRRSEPGETPATYRVLDGKKALEDALARRHCVVPDTLDTAGGRLRAIATTPGDPPCESVLLQTSRTGTLDTEIQDAVSNGFHVIGMASDDSGHAALLQRAAGGSKASAALVAASVQETLQQELSARAAAGYRIASSSAWKETLFSLDHHEEVPKVEYRVLSTTKSSTLEQELNAAAAKGFRFTPGTLHAVQKGAVPMFGRLGTDYVAVVESGVGAREAPYYMVGARRLSTLIREFDDAVAKGFAPVALALGYSDQETIVLFERPGK